MWKPPKSLYFLEFFNFQISLFGKISPIKKNTTTLLYSVKYLFRPLVLLGGNFSEFLEELSKCTGSCILISLLGVCVCLSLSLSLSLSLCFFPPFALCGRNSSGFGSFPFAQVCEKTDGSRDWLIFGALLQCNEICVYFLFDKDSLQFCVFICVFVCLCVCVCVFWNYSYFYV
jgi:hypothetical protein